MIPSVFAASAAVAGGLCFLLLAFAWVVRQPNFGTLPFPDGPRADAAALQRHVEFLASSELPRNARNADGLLRAANYIANAFSLTRARVSEQPYTVTGTTGKNLIARFGPDKGSLLVVGAHYDVFGNLPGADDNASGVAGLLELARLLDTRQLSSPVELVAFSNEEPPYFGGPEMGSAVHAGVLRDAGTSVHAMICLEMIGYFTPEQPNRGFALHIIYPRTGDFVAVAGRWSDRGIAREVKKSFRGASRLSVVSYSGPSLGILDLSDHRNYWAAGFPAVLITDTAFLRTPNYHSAADIPASLDYQRMAGVVDGILSAVVHLANDN